MARQETVSVQFKAGMSITEIQQQLKILQNNLNNLIIKDARLKNEFTSLFNELEKEFKHYQELVQNGFKTKADVTGFDKSVKQISSLMNRLVGTFDSVDNIDLNKIFYLDSNTTKKIDRLRQRVKELNDEIKSVNTGNLQNFKNLFNQLTLDSAKKGGQQISNLVNKGEIEEAIRLTDEYIQKYSRIIPMLQQQGKADKTEQNIKILQQIKTALAELDLTKLNQLNQELEQTQQQQKELETSSLSKYNSQLKELANDAKAAADATDDITRADKEAADAQRQFNNEIDNIKGKITYFFGLENAINLLRTAIRNAVESVKELDTAMTDTAVVTDFTVGDMWEALPEYTKVANELGATTLGAYETMTLFYQQGLETNQAFEVGTETMKMARIAAMDYTEATDLMTAALRGFNMELNETSARRINDVYSELAAITAADTHEIGIAMSKTASIANNANMEFETTAALLSQIIETTREAPETAGTAMKTIIARFSEVKELFSQGQLTGTDSEGEEININKIDTALQQVGISLKDFLIGNQGLDDVFLQLAERWDTLDLATQRYIATVAAGSRQQSRFLAMMSNYDRTMELVNAAYNSTGASQQQFEKTTDSLQAKLNELSNAWNEFTMGLTNNKLIKFGIDILTQFLTALNNLTDVLGEGTSGILKFIAAFGLFKGGKSLFNNLLGSFSKFWAEAKKESGDTGEQVAQNFYTKFANSFTNKKLNIKDLFNATMSSKDAESLIGSWVTSFDLTKNIGQNLADFTLQDNTLNLSKNTQEILKNISANTTLTNIEKTKATTMALTNSRLILYIKSLFGFTTESRKASIAALGLNTATSTLGATMKALPLGWIVAGIAAIYGAVKLLDVAIETPAERLERLNEEAEQSAQVAQDASQALTELGNSINSIKDNDSLFEGLTYGTIEWKNALIEANQQIIDLIEKYPELAQYVETLENGRLIIPEEQLETLYDEQLQKQQNAAFMSQIDQARVAQEELAQLQGQQQTAENRRSEIEREEQSALLSDDPKRNQNRNFDEEIAEQETQILNISNELKAKEVEFESLLTTAYSGLATNAENLSSTGQEALAQIMADVYGPEEFETLIKQKENYIHATGDDLDNLFEEVLGVIPDEDLSDKEKKRLIAEAQASEEVTKQANEVIDTVSQLNLDEGLSNIVLRGIQEDSQINISDLSALMTPVEEGGLGYTLEDLQGLSLEQLGVNVDDLAASMKISSDELKERFNTNIANATWAFGLVTDSANLTKEELDNLAIQLQEQKGVIDAGGQADLSGLTYQQMEALDFSGLTGEERTNMEQAVINAQEQKRQAVSNQNNLYNEAVSDQNSLNSAMQNADLTAEELGRVKGELIGLNPALKENEELLNEVSTMYLNMDTGLRKVADAWQANADALDNPDDVVEYSKAIGELQASVGTLLGTDVSYEFVEDNLDLIKEALDGNVDSLIELQRLSTLEFIGTLDLPTEDMKTLEDYAMKYNGFEMEMGAELDDTGFINTLNNMISEGLMTADQVQQYLNSIGYEADIVKQTQTLEQKTEFQGDGLLSWVKGSFTTSQEVPVITSIHALGDTAPRQAARASSSRGGSSGSTGSGGGGGSTKQEDPWENTFDRLYNLLEDINEEERIRNELELEFNRITEDGVYNSNQVLENLRQQEASLRRQQKMEQMLYNEREKEMRNLIAGNTDLQKYGTYNWADQTIEINWDLIESVTNNDTGERIEEYISELERIQESMDEAKDSLEDISDQIEELKDFGKDEFEEFENDTLEAIIHREESRIDELETISNSIDESNSKLIESLRDSIDEIRQARENEETEREISDTQNYLAYLQRDTSNANRLEILQTQDELDQQEQDYTDTLIDQKINELENQNNLAMEQRQQQIEIARAQLQHLQDEGLLWDEVYLLWQQGIDKNGVILPNSELDKLLKDAADYQSFSKFGKTQWASKMATKVEAADTWRKNTSGKGLNGVEAKLTTINTSIGKIKVGTSTAAKSKVSSGSGSSSSKSSSSGGSSSSSSSSRGSSTGSSGEVKKLQRLLNNYFGAKLSVDGIYGSGTKAAVRKMQKTIGASPADGLYGYTTKKKLETYMNRKLTSPTAAGNFYKYYFPNAIYKKGGLADFTGPAWLDGTKSKPELVLNAQDTQNFIALKDVLSDLMSSNFSSNTSKGGDNYYEVNIQVDELSNDYDVDQLAARVKKILSDDGRYRNVNTINLMR